MLRAPDVAAGQSSPCPGCGTMVTCPEPVYEAEVVLVTPKGAAREKSPASTSIPTRSLTIKAHTKPGPAEKPALVNPYLDVDDKALPTKAPTKPPAVNPYVDLDDDQAYSVINPPPALDTSFDSRRPCPVCREQILLTAAKCRYCGEIFDNALKKLDQKKPRKSRGRTAAAEGRDLLMGFVCFAVGTVLTLASYANAAADEKGGGRFLVFYGLILGGIAGMIRGVWGLVGSGR
jgi:hypothetical protein